MKELPGQGRPDVSPREDLTPSAVELINDSNYEAFRQQNPRAVLVIGAGWCGFCTQYKPVLGELAKKLLGVAFGYAALDEGHQIQVKRRYGSLTKEGIPFTTMLRYGEDIGGYYGVPLLENALMFLTTHLVQEQPIPDQFRLLP